MLGIGETKMGKMLHRSLRGLIQDAITKAVVNLGIETDRIKALYIGNFNRSHFCQQSDI